MKDNWLLVYHERCPRREVQLYYEYILPALESQYFTQSLDFSVVLRPAQLYPASGSHFPASISNGPPPPCEHFLHSPSLAFQSENFTPKKCSKPCLVCERSKDSRQDAERQKEWERKWEGGGRGGGGRREGGRGEGREGEGGTIYRVHLSPEFRLFRFFFVFLSFSKGIQSNLYITALYTAVTLYIGHQTTSRKSCLISTIKFTCLPGRGHSLNFPNRQFHYLSRVYNGHQIELLSNHQRIMTSFIQQLI